MYEENGGDLDSSQARKVTSKENNSTHTSTVALESTAAETIERGKNKSKQEKRNIQTNFLSLRLWVQNDIVRAVRNSSRFAIVTVAIYGMRASSGFVLGRLHEATNAKRTIAAMGIRFPSGPDRDN